MRYLFRYLTVKLDALDGVELATLRLGAYELRDHLGNSISCGT